MDTGIINKYGNQVRVRVCGLCWRGDDLLLVEHSGLTENGFWAPPGGGIEHGERVQDALRREFLEETGLNVVPGKFAFACEYVKDPLHAIELFFTVSETGGNLQTGSDPELQIIKQVRFVNQAELASIPPDSLHGLFRLAHTKDGIRRLSGFYSI